MKKILIMLIVSLTMVGCTNMDKSKQDEPILTDNKLIGIWDFVVPIENADWYVTEYFFYGNNKCSLLALITTANGINVLANEECSYRISDLNIYINDSLLFRYDEYNDNLVRADNSEIKYIKTTDNPCTSIYAHCE